MESKGSADDSRRKLAALLREDAGGIERDITGRMKALGGRPGGNGKLPEGLEGAVRAAIEQAFRAIEGKKDRHAPPEVIHYSRKLAEEGFEASALMRRCYQCLAVFREHLRQADASIKGRSQAGYAAADRAIDQLFERLQEKVEEAHRDVDEHLRNPRAIRLREEVRQALSGEVHHLPEDLGYDASATHIGIVGSGPGVEDEIKRLAKMLGGELLIVQDSPDRFWAWIGLKLASSAERLDDVLKAEWADTVRMGIGEPVADLPGWRRTHKQAQAAFSLTRPGVAWIVRYRDVHVLACIRRDELLTTSLHQDFLEPLEQESDGGVCLISTLETYLGKNRQISSTAKALGVDRRTVRARLDKIEARLGKTIPSVAFQLEAALLLRRYGAAATQERHANGLGAAPRAAHTESAWLHSSIR